ncbi:MAG: veratrol--corrinoid protein metyltransferase, partial [Spirochaetaceae bacterium]|nr:veratrol--corrinoid protein metyltransferase [Spirochaetaceae bacterium]
MAKKIETKLTPKENLHRMLHGQMPEWLPLFSIFPGHSPEIPEEPASVWYNPSALSGERGPQGGKDIWGVEWVPTKETGGGALPKPGDFILKDIRKWRDVIKAPDTSSWDWAALAKKDLDAMPVDRTQTAINFGVTVGYFQTLMSFMGFNEGLMAMAEEPEAVKELFQYLADFYVNVEEKMIDQVKPDTLQLFDDTAAEKYPFISKEMYRAYLLPHYDRHARYARERGLPIAMHNCRHSEVFFEDLTKIGAVQWDPVQRDNDIDGIQARYGRNLVLCGGWEARGRLLEEGVTDDELRRSVREAMD